MVNEFIIKFIKIKKFLYQTWNEFNYLFCIENCNQFLGLNF